MTYRQLQQALKQFKSEGLTTVKLNASKEVLEAEYSKLTKTETSKPTAQTYDKETWVWLAAHAKGKKLNGSKYCVTSYGHLKDKTTKQVYGFYTSAIVDNKMYCFDTNFKYWSSNRNEALKAALEHGCVALIA